MRAPRGVRSSLSPGGGAAYLLGGVDRVDEVSGVLRTEQRLSVRRASQVNALITAGGMEDKSEAQRRPSVALVPRGSLNAAGGLAELGELTEVFKDNAERDAVLRVWQRLKATHSDAGWFDIITLACSHSTCQP